MRKLFGTDGIRGQANRFPLTPATIVRIGQAVATVFGSRSGAGIIVGTDTRISGDMVVSAISSGICSSGANVLDSGILPTPGIAHLTAVTKSAVAGIVISASHNPYFDNGIKVFDGDGYKLSDEVENKIEDLVLSGKSIEDMGPDREIGRIIRVLDADERYLDFLRRFWPQESSLKGLKLVIDCANGATSRIAPVLFRSLGAEVIPLGVEPDGKNINADCGSEHTRLVSQTTTTTGADMGLSFDGDGDRLAVVDETGQVLTGDQVLVILADYLKSRKALRNNVVVSTIMSNIGISIALDRMKIRHEVADVGDRRVMEKMKTYGAVLGGEESGHIIFLDRHTTGDGLMSALLLLEIIAVRNRPLSELAGIMTVAPQVRIDVPVNEKPELNSIGPVRRIIEEISSNLEGEGRVLVRYSGTQPICRVMVEGPTTDLTQRYCQKIADVIFDSIGGVAAPG